MSLFKRDIKSEDFVLKSQKLAFIFFCIVLFDCAILGSGRLIEFFGISFRMLCCVLSFLFCVPSIFSNLKSNLKNPVIIGTAVFFVWLAVSAVRGFFNQNNMTVLLSDIKGFFYLLLIPVAVNCVTNKERLKRLSDVIIIAAAIQAAFVLIVNAVSVMFSQTVLPLSRFILLQGLGSLSAAADNIYRIFMKSSPYMIVACVLVFARLFESEKIQWKYTLAVAVYINAILFSYTRSLFGSLGITAIVTLIVFLLVEGKNFKRLLKHTAVIIACFLVLVGVGEIVFQSNNLNFAIARTLNIPVRSSFTSTLVDNVGDLLKDAFSKDKEDGKDNSDEDDNSSDADRLHQLEQQNNYVDSITKRSDKLRKITEQELLEHFYKSPIIGRGLGACSATRNGNDEYFYLDVLARMGIVGLILYVAPFVWVLICLLKQRKMLKDNIICVATVLSLTAFWVATAFNPWMNAAIGISWYAAVSAVPTALKGQNIKNNIQEILQDNKEE